MTVDNTLANLNTDAHKLLLQKMYICCLAPIYFYSVSFFFFTKQNKIKNSIDKAVIALVIDKWPTVAYCTFLKMTHALVLNYLDL